MQLSDQFQFVSAEKTSEGRRLEWVKASVLLSLALYFAYVILSGNLTNYINNRFTWLSYLAVVIFGALGLATIYALVKKHPEVRDAMHTPVSWSMVAIVAIPLVLGTLIPSQPLGASAVDGRIGTRVVTVNTASAITKDPLDRNILDWLRVFSGSTAPASFDGEQADVIGFVYREPTFEGDQFMVGRFTVACCVADASAIALPVVWPGIGEIGDGEWVRVRGTFQAGQFRDAMQPILIADSVEIVDEPEHPYLYP